MSVSTDRLRGQVAIVTGAGSGIGRATAVRLAGEGAEVVAADIRPEAAAATVEEFAGAGLAVTVDIADPESVASMVEATESWFGGIDFLHCNAAVPQAATPLTELTVEVWRRTLDVNLTGTFLCVQAVVPAMRRRGGGSIVVTSSVAAVRPRQEISAYIASKSGMIGFARSVALELAEERIRVNVVLPGPVQSPLTAAMQMTGAGEETDLASLAASIPLGELIEAESVAAAVVFFAGADAAQVTGAVLNVDGGRGL